jgi:hypothetical protein
MSEAGHESMPAPSAVEWGKSYGVFTNDDIIQLEEGLERIYGGDPFHGPNEGIENFPPLNREFALPNGAKVFVQLDVCTLTWLTTYTEEDYNRCAPWPGVNMMTEITPNGKFELRQIFLLLYAGWQSNEQDAPPDIYATLTANGPMTGRINSALSILYESIPLRTSEPDMCGARLWEGVLRPDVDTVSPEVAEPIVLVPDALDFARNLTIMFTE